MKIIKKQSSQKHNVTKYINIKKFEAPELPVLFILGARGVGKTISSIADNIKKYFPIGEQFIYLRRYQSEIDTLGINLALVSELTGYDVTRETVKMTNGQTVDCLCCNAEPVCLLISLNTSGKVKSNDFSKVSFIVYDEFIDLKNRELKNETFLFMQFAMTVFRDFSKYKVTFLANSTNVYNNYFLDFEVMPKSRITKFRSKGIKIVMYETSEELNKERNSTVLAKQVRLIEGEDNSSLDNHFTNIYNDFLIKLGKKSQQRMIFWLDGVAYGVWRDSACYIISEKVNLNATKEYVLLNDQLREGKKIIPFEIFTQFRDLLQNSQLYFTNAKVRTLFIKYFLMKDRFNV